MRWKNDLKGKMFSNREKMWRKQKWKNLVSMEYVWTIMEYISKFFNKRRRLIFWERIIYINHILRQILWNNVIWIISLIVTDKVQNALVSHTPNIFFNYVIWNLENLNRDIVKKIKYKAGTAIVHFQKQNVL